MQKMAIEQFSHSIRALGVEEMGVLVAACAIFAALALAQGAVPLQVCLPLAPFGLGS